MYSVTEVEIIFGISSETIRNWERRGILTADYVSPTKRKYYGEKQIRRLYSSGIQSVAKYNRAH